jgi:hypothetical protein
MVKSTISLKTWLENTLLLLGTYSEACMTFLLKTMKITFDLLLRSQVKKAVFVYKTLCYTSIFISLLGVLMG